MSRVRAVSVHAVIRGPQANAYTQSHSPEPVQLDLGGVYLYSSSALTLIFAVSALHFLVDALLHFSLQDSRAGWLVVCSGLQDVRRVDPVICEGVNQCAIRNRTVMGSQRRGQTYRRGGA
jgi:hypothetical protein